MGNLIACHDCDLLHEIRPLPEGGTALCSRCGAVLFRSKRNPLDRTLAMAFTALVLFGIANLFPFLAMEKTGFVRETTLITGIFELYRQEMHLLGTLVLLTAVVVPFLEILGLIYVFLPLKLKQRPPLLGRVWRVLAAIKGWSMMEVFMLGTLLSLVKLTKLAVIVPGIAIYAFSVLILVLAASSTFLDPQLVWDALEED